MMHMPRGIVPAARKLLAGCSERQAVREKGDDRVAGRSLLHLPDAHLAILLHACSHLIQLRVTSTAYCISALQHLATELPYTHQAMLG